MKKILLNLAFFKYFLILIIDKLSFSKLKTIIKESDK